MNGSRNERNIIQIKGAALKRHMKITEKINKIFFNLSLTRIHVNCDSENSVNLISDSNKDVKSNSDSVIRGGVGFSIFSSQLVQNFASNGSCCPQWEQVINGGFSSIFSGICISFSLLENFEIIK